MLYIMDIQEFVEKFFSVNLLTKIRSKESDLIYFVFSLSHNYWPECGRSRIDAPAFD